MERGRWGGGEVGRGRWGGRGEGRAPFGEGAVAFMRRCEGVWSGGGGAGGEGGGERGRKGG